MGWAYPSLLILASENVSVNSWTVYSLLSLFTGISDYEEMSNGREGITRRNELGTLLFSLFFFVFLASPSSTPPTQTLVKRAS